jgi:ABC-type lipoprotein release transport system permease subunit
MKPRLVLAQVAIESALLVGIGVILGAAAAVALVTALSGGVDFSFVALGAEYFGAGHVLYPRIAVGESIGVSVLIWALGVLVSLWPARRAAKSNPVEAMSHAT